MKIENNILKHYLKNVYFITGTAYSGKSTAVKMLARQYGMIECGENYHMAVSEAVATPETHPDLCYNRMLTDWRDFVKRPRFRDTYGFVFDEESLAIAALLHDVCKTNFYKTEMRNVKKNGVWESVPYYTIEDTLPYGHGEKSVYIVSGFMKLTRDEAFAIRYHMGFSGPEDANQVGKALEMFPLAFALCVADMEASYYMEGILPKNT